jgi:hypothetical protein
MPIPLDIQYETPLDVKSDITRYLKPKTEQVSILKSQPLETLPYTLKTKPLSISYSSLEEKPSSAITQAVKDAIEYFNLRVEPSINIWGVDTSFGVTDIFGEKKIRLSLSFDF